MVVDMSPHINENEMVPYLLKSKEILLFKSFCIVYIPASIVS